MASNNIQEITAGEPGDANIPCTLNAPALLISSAPAIVSKIPTIFVGIVDSSYTEAHWTDNCSRIKSLFEITDDSLVGEIKVVNRGNQTIDSKKLTLDMKIAVECMNGQPFDYIRIVRMGIGSSIAVDQALESLVRGWKLPPQNKYIQLVAVGESLDQHNLNFCKMLCLKELCHTVQYYNTMDYNDFGYIDFSQHLIQLLANRLRIGNRTGTQPDD